MKKIIYTILVLGLIFSACNPMDDIYTTIDATETPIVGEATYILTDDDYDDLDLGFGSFSSLDDAKTMLPPFFAEMFPVWGKNSGVLAGFKLYVGNAPGVGDYTYADDYSLTEDDYALSGSDVSGFYPDANPFDYFEDILSAGVSAPQDGENILVKYKQYTEVPVKTVTSNYVIANNFDYGTTAGILTSVTTDWTNHSGGTNAEYDTSSLSMTGYPSSGIGGSLSIGSGDEDVNSTFSPISSGTVYSSALVNLSAVGDGTYFIHFMNDGFNYTGRIGAKDDGSGKILFGIGASSSPSDSDYGTTAYDLNTTYLLVGSYNIDTGVSNLYVLTSPEATEPATPEATSTGTGGYGVQKIGIRQGFGGPSGTIDGVRVATSWDAIMIDDVAIAVSGAYKRKEIFYTYSGGNWDTSEGVYFISDDDFDSMGEASGQPGRYNNFGSTTPPDDYLPTFLGLKYPYAMEEDELMVIYDYFSSSSGAQLRGNVYTVIDGVWVGHQSTIDTTLQFGHDGNTWVPDNTIKYTLVSADYVYMADELTGNSDYDNVSLPNLASYGDFDYNWTDDQVLEALGILLDHLDPGAAEGQKYILTYLLYDNGINELKMFLIKTGGAWVLNE